MENRRPRSASCPSPRLPLWAAVRAPAQVARRTRAVLRSPIRLRSPTSLRRRRRRHPHRPLHHMTVRSARFLPLPPRRRHLRRTAAVGRL